MNTISEQIAMLRKENNMTQEELAARIGVSAQTISKWECGITMPDILLLPMIADMFHVTIDGLYGKQNRHRMIAFDDVPEAAYDNLLQTMQRSREHGEQVSEVLIGNEDAAEKTKEYLISHPDSQTAIYADAGGAVYANAELGLIFRKPMMKPSEMLSDEIAGEFLAKLSDGAFRKVLLYLIDHVSISFTASSVASRCDVTAEAAANVLGELVEYGFASCNHVDMGEEELHIYRLHGGHKLLLVYTILRLAHRLADYHEHYRGFRGAPNEWFC